MYTVTLAEELQQALLAGGGDMYEEWRGDEIQRRVLIILDEEEREKRLQKFEAKTSTSGDDTSSACEAEVARYDVVFLQRLREARDTLLGDPHLREGYLFGQSDPTLWASPEDIWRAASIKAPLLPQVSSAERLIEAAAVHLNACKLPGRYELSVTSRGTSGFGELALCEPIAVDTDATSLSPCEPPQRGPMCVHTMSALPSWRMPMREVRALLMPQTTEARLQQVIASWNIPQVHSFQDIARIDPSSGESLLISSHDVLARKFRGMSRKFLAAALANNAKHRIRLRGGVYTTPVDVNEMVVIVVRPLLSNTSGKGSPSTAEVTDVSDWILESDSPIIEDSIRNHANTELWKRWQSASKQGLVVAVKVGGAAQFDNVAAQEAACRRLLSACCDFDATRFERVEPTHCARGSVSIVFVRSVRNVYFTVHGPRFDETLPFDERLYAKLRMDAAAVKARDATRDAEDEVQGGSDVIPQHAEQLIVQFLQNAPSTLNDICRSLSLDQAIVKRVLKLFATYDNRSKKYYFKDS